MNLQRSRVRIWVLGVLLATAGVACGDDGGGGGDDTQAQVAPDVTTFVGGSLDDLPVPPRAEPLGPLRESDDGILVRSYEVRDTTGRQVMDFYEELLADRPVVSPVENAPGSGDVLRGEWRLEDGVLRITTQAAPTVDEQDGDDDVTTQLSLQLTPD